MNIEENRLRELITLIDERVEPDYGYTPEFEIFDAEEVDFYVQELIDVIDELTSSGKIDENFWKEDDIIQCLEEI